MKIPHHIIANKDWVSFFSLLEPGAHIVPHAATSNMKITGHLGLSIPKTEEKNNSYIRVADQFFHWEDGEIFLFDDSFVHEVWHYNERNESRLILQFQFRHPDLMPDEIPPVIKYNMFGKYVPN